MPVTLSLSTGKELTEDELSEVRDLIDRLYPSNCFTSNSYVMHLGCVGATGPIGATGPTGPSYTGSTGPAGATGPT